MEEYTGRERSPPPDPAESAAAEIPVPNSATPTGRTFQDNFNSPQMPASPTGGQGLTQEALIEVLRNQHQNIVQQQNLIAGQGAQISELAKLVSGLVQMQTDVLKDQAQREADERERKAEEERKAAEEAATSTTPRAGSLFTSAPKKSDSKYSGSSGGKMESYIPNCPQLEIKDSGRRHEINTWLSFRERFGSWLCLLDECYAAELQEAVKQTTTIEQGKLAPEAAVRSSKLYHWMKQAMSGYKRGLDLAVLQEREQGGLTCGYELFRRINNLLGVTTRGEALSLREAVMRLDVNGLKQLGCPSAGSVKNPLDTCLFLTQEFARLRDQCAAFADLQMMEVDQIMVMMRCLPQEIHRHLAFHGKSSTLRELMESLEFYEQQSKALDFSRDSHKGNPVGYDRPPKGSPKGGKDRTPKGEGKGKEIRCRRCGKPGHVEKDCWSKSPKRTDKDKGKGKGSEKGGKPKGGKDRSHSPYDPKKKGNPKGGKPKGSKGELKGGKGPKGGKPKGACASVGDEDEEDVLGMGCVLDMTVPPDVLLNQLHSYGNRLTTSSVADTDATDPHFLVDSGASIHLISQSLVDEGYLQICREWAVNERCTTANGQEMILNRCVEAEFSTYALKSRHVSFLECDGAAASSPDAASPAAASSRAAAPSPAAPASSSLSPVSRSICAGSQLQRPQKLRVTGLIGYGQVSLLSVALLASKGWTFSCSPGKSCSRTSREADKPAKPPCLSLSHFGGHDQVLNRTRSSRLVELILTFFFGAMFLGSQLSTQEPLTLTCHCHSVRCSTRPMLTPVRTVLFVIRPCMKQFKIRSCMLQSVKVQVRCTGTLTVRTSSSSGFVEWSMPSDAWVDTTELSGEKKKEQSPDTVMEEPTEPAPGTVIAQVGQQDAEKEPSEPREREETAPKEETRRVVLVTMEPEESTEVIVKPPEQEPEKSTEATVKPTEPVEKEKGLEMEKRESEVPKDLPEPEIPEKPFVEMEKAQEAASEQEVTFRMKAWSNWLHRQDQKDEEKRIRNRARQRALRQQRRSDRAAGLQQAVRKGPSL